MRIKYFFSLLLFILVFCSCGQKQNAPRNEIIFRNNISEVADSLYSIELVLKRLPKAQMVNYFLDDGENLFVNNKKLGPLKAAEVNFKIRNDNLFAAFSDADYKRFIYLINYLLSNNIDSSRKDQLTGAFLHEYRRSNENNYEDLREIILDARDFSVKFKSSFQVLDKKGRLTLVAPSGVKIK